MAEAVVIIGSPRSGTSLSTNVTFEMGYHADFERANKFNENGIWENDELVTINEILMNYFGTGMLHPNALPPDWKAANLGRLKVEAANLIQRMNSFGRWA